MGQADEEDQGIGAKAQHPEDELAEEDDFDALLQRYEEWKRLSPEEQEQLERSARENRQRERDRTLARWSSTDPSCSPYAAQTVTNPRPQEQLTHPDRDEQAVEAISRRSGVPASHIHEHQWYMCEVWREGRSEHNCAFALLNTEDIPLPDHVCTYVASESVSLYMARYRTSWEITVAHNWSHQKRLPDGAVPFCIVERVIPDEGEAILFGVLVPTPGEPPDDQSYTPTVYDCSVRTSDGGTDIGDRLRSWYDGLFRGHRVGRPSGSRWTDEELRIAFEQALRTLRRNHIEITEATVITQMGVSKSTLYRRMKRGVIPWAREWDALKA